MKSLARVPAVRTVARSVLTPVIVRRRVPATSYRIRFPAGQYLGWLGKGFRSEQEIARHFCTLIRPGDTVIDVGANVGFYTMLAAHLVGPRGRVHAFEPDPQSMWFLLRTVRANDLTARVTLWAIAAGDSQGDADLFLDLKTARTTSLSAEAYSPDAQVRQSIKIATGRLDDLIKEPVQFVKIDVEGAELSTLAGASQLILRSRPVILIEVLREHLSEASSFLSQLGYDVVDVRSGREVTDGDYSGNLLAVYSTFA